MLKTTKNKLLSKTLLTKTSAMYRNFHDIFYNKNVHLKCDF